LVILLTQIDRVPNGNLGNRDVFYNDPIRNIVQTINNRLIHVPINRIFPVKNYDSHYMINSESSTLILLAFREILRLCERNALSKHYYPCQQQPRRSLRGWLPKNAKHTLIVLVCLSVVICFVMLRPTIIWRKSVIGIIVGLLGEWCLVAGIGDYVHFEHLFDEDEIEEHEAGEEEGDDDDYYEEAEDDYY